MFAFLAPFSGYGGGADYRLTSVREVKVTEEFMSLDLKTRNCQNETTVHDCQQEKYLVNLTVNCHCIPFYFRNYSSEFQRVDNRPKSFSYSKI